ncbi:helix-turn-helix transcriptional regulator [Kitasatospora paracochleata]|uniref:DNA-binding NarL/FixJ family response regulator n=1 Tax=Kitasatospora paracochleata TaxID=58354 RepID=A0ABT1ITM8_9ACTN|nr:response regulator transcription factor [Kitasatospora paracochleata]MCP2308266.1 DNA-binding NarL/FixJ family response regulator [Kitasatospora paracochleata]
MRKDTRAHRPDTNPGGYCVITETIPPDEQRPGVVRDDGLRILVAVNSDVVRVGLCSIIQQLPLTRQVVGHGSLDEAFTALSHSRCDVVIASAGMENDQLTELRDWARSEETKLLLLLSDPSHLLNRTAALSADGFLMEATLTTTAVADTLSRVHAGDLPVPAELTRELVSMAQTAANRVPRQRTYLTARERQTLRHLVDGLSNRQIAAAMDITEHGAKRHVANVLAKLNCPNRTLAAAMAVREGIVADQG